MACDCGLLACDCGLLACVVRGGSGRRAGSEDRVRSGAVTRGAPPPTYRSARTSCASKRPPGATCFTRAIGS
ncbi:MAG TPA: hypothetical protein VFQ07_11230, partial [Candidatus Polarisedimenticolia bacterium]|nr:hypothetical protein [Candidatus Polarisedimenticolia bacterium]